MRCRRTVEEGAPPDESRPKGMIDIDDFDSTLYFLDDTEVKYLETEVEREYSRDLRASSMAALFDIFELNPRNEVHTEVTQILESLFPNLLNAGEFQACAAILRETRAPAGSPESRSKTRERLLDFDRRLSEPTIVGPVAAVLRRGRDAARTRDVGSCFEAAPARGARDRSSSGLPRLRFGGRCELSSPCRTTWPPATPEVLRVLRSHESEALAGVIDSVRPTGAGCRRRRSGQCAGHDDEAIAPGRGGGAGTHRHAWRHDPGGTRAGRQGPGRPHGGGQARGPTRLQGTPSVASEEVVLGKRLKDSDFGEKRAFFEAYGAIAGAWRASPWPRCWYPGVLRRKRNAEVRMCAALALGPHWDAGGSGRPQRRSSNDRDRQVRNAVAAALKAYGFMTDDTGPNPQNADQESRPGGGSDDGFLRHGGRGLLLSLYAALRSLKLYPVENETVQKGVGRSRHLRQGHPRGGGGDREFAWPEISSSSTETRLRLELDNYASFSQILSILPDVRHRYAACGSGGGAPRVAGVAQSAVEPLDAR